MSMSREVKCGSCGVKQDFAQMNKCPNCKKYYCNNCVDWSLTDEYHGESAKYYLKCSRCNAHLGTDWKSPRNTE